MPDRLPELLDNKRLRSELGVSKAAAEKLMQRLPTVTIEGLRKVYVKRADVLGYLDARTFTKDQVCRSERARIVRGAGRGGFRDKTPPALAPLLEG